MNAAECDVSDPVRGLRPATRSPLRFVETSFSVRRLVDGCERASRAHERDDGVGYNPIASALSGVGKQVVDAMIQKDDPDDVSETVGFAKHDAPISFVLSRRPSIGSVVDFARTKMQSVREGQNESFFGGKLGECRSTSHVFVMSTGIDTGYECRVGRGGSPRGSFQTWRSQSRVGLFRLEVVAKQDCDRIVRRGKLHACKDARKCKRTSGEELVRCSARPTEANPLLGAGFLRLRRTHRARVRLGAWPCP